MHWTPISRLFGMLLMLYSASFAHSIGVALFYQDDQWSIFAISLAITLLAGLAMWFPVRQSSSEISVREGYFVVPGQGFSPTIRLTPAREPVIMDGMR